MEALILTSTIQMLATTASTVTEWKGQTTTTTTPVIAVARPRRMCQPRPSSSGWLSAKTVWPMPSRDEGHLNHPTGRATQWLPNDTIKVTIRAV